MLVEIYNTDCSEVFNKWGKSKNVPLVKYEIAENWLNKKGQVNVNYFDF